MSGLSTATAKLPSGYRLTRADDDSVEISPPQPSWGWGMVAFWALWCAGWDIGLLASVGVGARMSWAGWPEDPVARWLAYFPFFWIPGLVLTALTLYQIFVRQVWIFSFGRFTRRYMALGLQLRFEHDLTEVEVVHGIWKTGRGATDMVLLRTARYHDLGLFEARGFVSAASADVLGMAAFIVQHTEAPLRVREAVIPEPSSD